MNDVGALHVTVGTLLLMAALVAVVGGEFSMLLAILVLVGGGGGLIVVESLHHGDGHPMAERDDVEFCAECGATIPAGDGRCEDCTVVGAWRK